MKNNHDKKEYAGPGKIALVNSITGLRFIASLLVLPVFKAFGGVTAAIYSVIFMLTDWVDGKMARSFNASTFFGSMFDGATDKAFIVLTFALLLAFNPVVFSIPLLFELGIIIVQKNKMKKGLNVKSNMIGKIKTWVLSASMVASLGAVELLNLKPVFEYMKTFSLSKAADIKDFLVLLGINLPGIVFQLLTLRSYSEELKTIEVKEEKTEEVIQESKKEEVKFPETILHEITMQKDELKRKYTMLEKAQILGNAMFDPEYYDKNKDRQIRVLTKELFTKKD